MSALDEIAALLGSLPLFHDLPPDLRRLVASRAEVRHAAAGAVLFRQGDPGTDFLVVLSGKVRIEIPSGDGEETLAELGPGGWFGEMALITGEPRSAGARALEDTVLAAVGHDPFHDLLAQHPPLSLALGQELSRRLRASLLGRSSRRSPRVLVLEDGAASAAALPEIARAVEEETGVLPRLADLASGAALPAASARLLLVRAVPGDPRAAALADRPDAAVARGLLADWPGLSGTPASPLLVSPRQARIRELLRRRVGLALGAGGAKGLAHAGAVRAMARAGVRFDLLAGSSIGAIVAGMLALGWPPTRIDAFFVRMRDGFGPLLVDLGIPRGALLKGVKKTRLIRAEAGEVRIEDLPVPLSVAAADLRRGREAALTSGPLWQALDASTALPTVFPPVAIDGRLHADGWIVNPLPTDALRRMGADVVIAVDPNAADDPEARAARPRRRRRWRRWLHPSVLIDPAGMMKGAMRALDVGARERVLANLELADVPITPPLGAFSFTAVHRLDEIAAVGERAAEEALATWRRSYPPAEAAPAEGTAAG